MVLCIPVIGNLKKTPVDAIKIVKNKNLSGGREAGKLFAEFIYHNVPYGFLDGFEEHLEKLSNGQKSCW